MTVSPTQRSKKLLEERGYLVAVVEHWNPHARIRQDLFGFIDLIALGGDRTLAVQTTTGSNAAARVKKIREHPNLVGVTVIGGWSVVVHAWTRPAKSRSWVCREIEVAT